MNVKTGAVIASAVAMLFSTTACNSGDDGGEGGSGSATQSVKCEGVNECKGTSECAGKDGKNECQGLNECAGQGWVTVPSADECTSQGGTVLS